MVAPPVNSVSGGLIYNLSLLKSLNTWPEMRYSAICGGVGVGVGVSVGVTPGGKVGPSVGMVVGTGVVLAQLTPVSQSPALLGKPAPVINVQLELPSIEVIEKS